MVGKIFGIDLRASGESMKTISGYSLARQVKMSF
jgi:hypothetical protein